MEYKDVESNVSQLYFCRSRIMLSVTPDDVSLFDVILVTFRKQFNLF